MVYAQMRAQVFVGKVAIFGSLGLCQTGADMKKIGKFIGAIVTGFFTMAGTVMAAPCGGPNLPPCQVPEPGSLYLVALGVVGAVAVARYLKK